jgi:hypothetical protein
MADKDADEGKPTSEQILIELRLRAEALEKQLTEVQKKAEARLVQAELKAEAMRAGIIDPDGLKLLDLSKIKLNDLGEVENASSLIAQMKQVKPWLFSASASSSSAAASAPPAEPPRQKLATEMTEDEWRSARAALLRRR